MYSAAGNYFQIVSANIGKFELCQVSLVYSLVYLSLSLFTLRFLIWDYWVTWQCSVDIRKRQM